MEDIKEIYTYIVARIPEGDSYTTKKFRYKNSVIEYPGTYEQADNNKLYTNWSVSPWRGKDRNYLPKSCIREVETSVYGTTAIYATYLLEDNEEVAFELIADKCREDIGEIAKELAYRKSVLTAIHDSNVNKKEWERVSE